LKVFSKVTKVPGVAPPPSLPPQPREKRRDGIDNTAALVRRNLHAPLFMNAPLGVSALYTKKAELTREKSPAARPSYAKRPVAFRPALTSGLAFSGVPPAGYFSMKKA